MTLGEQIKQAREEKNLSQEELASKLDISRQAISKWENDISIPKGINREMLNQTLDLQIELDDNENNMTGKYRKLMILGWMFAVIFAISTIVLSIVLYKVKSHTDDYLPQETISMEMIDGSGVSGTDSNTESVYIYHVDGLATEEEVSSYDNAPNEE